MSESAKDLKLRTKQFALRVIKLVTSLPKSLAAQTIGKQMLRSGTSVGANYRAASRGRSKAEFRAKLGIVLEESDETSYWIELLQESGLMSATRLEPLRKEADEITAIMVAAINSSRDR